MAVLGALGAAVVALGLFAATAGFKGGDGPAGRWVGSRGRRPFQIDGPAGPGAHGRGGVCVPSAAPRVALPSSSPAGRPPSLPPVLSLP